MLEEQENRYGSVLGRGGGGDYLVVNDVRSGVMKEAEAEESRDSTQVLAGGNKMVQCAQGGSVMGGGGGGDYLVVNDGRSGVMKEAEAEESRDRNRIL